MWEEIKKLMREGDDFKLGSELLKKMREAFRGAEQFVELTEKVTCVTERGEHYVINERVHVNEYGDNYNYEIRIMQPEGQRTHEFADRLESLFYEQIRANGELGDDSNNFFYVGGL